MERRSKQLEIVMLNNDIAPKEMTNYLAELLGKGPQYVRARMTGRQSWTFAEARLISSNLNIPDDAILRVFG